MACSSSPRPHCWWLLVLRRLTPNSWCCMLCPARGEKWALQPPVVLCAASSLRVPRRCLQSWVLLLLLLQLGAGLAAVHPRPHLAPLLNHVKVEVPQQPQEGGVEAAQFMAVLWAHQQQHGPHQQTQQAVGMSAPSKVLHACEDAVCLHDCTVQGVPVASMSTRH
jgi:hypothetical protein